MSVRNIEAIAENISPEERDELDLSKKKGKKNNDEDWDYGHYLRNLPDRMEEGRVKDYWKNKEKTESFSESRQKIGKAIEQLGLGHEDYLLQKQFTDVLQGPKGGKISVAEIKRLKELTIINMGFIAPDVAANDLADIDRKIEDYFIQQGDNYIKK